MQQENGESLDILSCPKKRFSVRNRTTSEGCPVDLIIKALRSGFCLSVVEDTRWVFTAECCRVMRLNSLPNNRHQGVTLYGADRWQMRTSFYSWSYVPTGIESARCSCEQFRRR